MQNPFTEINDKLDFLVDLISRKQEDHSVTSDLEDSLLNLSEAEKLLHMPASTIHFHKKHNNLPFLKPGKRLLFEREKLLEWLKSFKTERPAIDQMRHQRQRYAK